jgi:predicted ATPase with chaperone activity
MARVADSGRFLLGEEGAAFELPIALAALEAGGLLEENALDRWVMGGELSLDGVTVTIDGKSAPISFISPDHMALLFRERMGQMMLVGAIVLQTIGFIWIRQVIKIEV